MAIPPFLFPYKSIIYPSNSPFKGVLGGGTD